MSKDATTPENGAAQQAPRAAKAAPESAPAEAAEKKKPATRIRRAPVRPPRRDWAAEAAAAPVDAPAPAPTSLATSPSDDGAGAVSPAKRRRGTRGGRGRKKPGAVANGDSDGALIETVHAAEPVTIEAAIAQQSAVLEHFAREVSTTLKTLQTAVTQLQEKVDRPAAVTSHPRVGIFVDVPNLIYASERRNVPLDFGRVLDYFTRGRELVRASAYAPISDDPMMKLESQRFVHHFVGHPYRIVTKPLKRFADGSMKANFDIELAIDILTMSDRLDIVVLMSGDGDFRRLVELIASRGVRVEVVAFGEAASAELKAVADLYIDIGAHLDDFKVLK